MYKLATRVRVQCAIAGVNPPPPATAKATVKKPAKTPKPVKKGGALPPLAPKGRPSPASAITNGNSVSKLQDKVVAASAEKQCQ